MKPTIANYCVDEFQVITCVSAGTTRECQLEGWCLGTSGGEATFDASSDHRSENVGFEGPTYNDAM
jgi:hypothetical protein